MQPLKRNLWLPKKVPKQTTPEEDISKLGLAEETTGNGTKNGSCIRSRKQCRTNEEKVKLSVEGYDTLKWRLETVKRLNVFLETFESFWKAERESLKTDLKKTLTSSECKIAYKSFVKTSSTSAFRNNSYQRNLLFHSLEKDRLQLKKKLHDMNVSHPISTHIYSFFDNFMAFAHHYVSGVCEEAWFKLNDEMSCASNEVNSTNKIVRNWRARCF